VVAYQVYQKFRVASLDQTLRYIPNKDLKRMLERINLLLETPKAGGCIKLSGQKQYRAKLFSTHPKSARWFSIIKSP
jgi:hypothetical protein